jgi:hypothetical protein
MSNLPEIIKEPGIYRTRGGRIVEIFVIREGSPATFKAKGYLHIPRKAGKDKVVYDIWQTNGHIMAIGENPNDIISFEKRRMLH